MLVLSRKELESICIGPTARFSETVVELLRTRCPALTAEAFVQVGEALLQLHEHPLFNFKIQVTRICQSDSKVRIGTEALREWQVDREEVFENRRAEKLAG